MSRGSKPRALQLEGLPHQFDFWSDYTDLISLGLVGPLGTGKTRSLVIKDLLLHLRNVGACGRGFNSMMVEPTFGMVDDILIPAYVDVIGGELGIPVRVKLQRGRPRVVWPSQFRGAQTLLRSAEKPERLAGSNLTHVGFDEPGQMAHDAWKKGSVRAREPQRIPGYPIRQKFAAGSPEGIASWFAKLFDDPDETDQIRTIRACEWHRVLSWYPAEIRRQFKSDPAQLAAYLDAQFVPMFGGRCYKAFDETQVVPALPLDPFAEIILACDFNVDYMRWLLMQVIRREVRFCHELAMPYDSDTQQAVTRLCDELLPPMGDRTIIVTGDAAGKARSTSGETDYELIGAEFRRRGISHVLDVPDANPLQQDRVQNFNLLLSGYDGWSVRIAAECQSFLRDLRQVVWAPRASSASPPQIDKKDPELTHASDAGTYGAWVRARCTLLVATAAAVGDVADRGEVTRRDPARQRW